MTTDCAFEARGLSKRFGDVLALDGVSLKIPRGDFYGLLGPNGAGKSTMMRLLAGLLEPDSGELLVQGTTVARWEPRSELGVVPQEIALYDVLSAETNLEIFGKLRGLRGLDLKSRIDSALELVELTARRKSLVKTFSGGMKRRLNLACSLLHDPDILLLDEPTVGVDPQSRAKIFALLEDLHRRGKTLLYTTHYMEEAERLCQHIGIIDHGNVLAEGTLQDLIQKVRQPRFVRVHLIGQPETVPAIPDAEADVHDTFVDFRPLDPTRLGRVVSAIEDSAFVYDRMEIVGPNLETLFLEMTGKELRDR